MPDEHRFFVDGRIPVLKVHFEPRPGPAVIVLHGLGASSEVQRPELISLAHSGLTAVSMDAPHHGARRDGWLDEMDRLGLPHSHERLLQLILEAAPDVSRVIDHLVYEGHGPIGLAGISLGAYTALTVATWDARVRATVSILGSPDWTPRDGNITHEMRQLMHHAPVHRPRDLARHPLMLVNAGRDGLVPAHWARDFARRIHEHEHWPERYVEYIEYPESDHMMRPEDWEDLWKRARGFLRWHLS
jgi:hypothetical protein